MVPAVIDTNRSFAHALALCLTSTDNIPYPFFEERIPVGWTPTIPTTDYPPSFSATSLAWTGLDDPAILYATEGAGAWRGSMSW